VSLFLIARPARDGNPAGWLEYEERTSVVADLGQAYGSASTYIVPPPKGRPVTFDTKGEAEAYVDTLPHGQAKHLTICEFSELPQRGSSRR
jgi:hypothetical protein